MSVEKKFVAEGLSKALVNEYLAEELITRLYSTGKFEVIERQLLNKVLNEHKLTFSGLIDASSAQAVGKILGIDAIASGTVTDLGPSVKVNARLISTETGKIFAVASVDIVKDAIVSKLMAPASALAGTETRQKLQPVPTEKAFPEITAEIDAYLFKVTGCRSSSGLIICDIQVTNNAPNDRDLTIWFLPTKAWDNNGKNYYLHQLVFADQRFRVRTADGWSGSSRNGGKLISGVPVKLEIVLGELRTPIDKLSLLEIACGSFTVKLRDIPIKSQH